ncbi:MAG TPA: outer membrane protein assembly factor BamA [Spirochaetota bacterium]|nr:outer membrane protein assembly factor BamA [Spirochaetota bacterium]HOD14057.1 outer membrane protein assembly factor BamA [Spirochaetota bacterium]HPN12649.1 outer membrane protein assembly factor BamA [Spirochaetota bacterium]
MRNLAIALVSLAVLCALPMLYPQPSKYEGKKVVTVLFEGLKNVDEDDLLYIMKTTSGYPLKALELREDIKKIFKKGNFESIAVEIEEYMDGVRLKFICKERPLVKEVVFKGLDEVSESDLTTVIPVKEGAVIRKDYLEKSVAAIKKKYEEEGLFNAVIRYDVKPVRGDENNVRVVFIIDEGEEIRVRKLSVLGARKLGTRELLAVMETSEKGLFKDGDFKRDVWEQDKAKVLAYYRQNGYLEAQILDETAEYEWVNPEKKDKRGIFLTLKVSEGEQFYFDKYSVRIEEKGTAPVFKPKVFMDNFEQTRSGAIFNDTLFQQDRQMISFKYASKGYIFARVQPNRTVTEREVKVKGKLVKRKFVAIEFVIEEGTQAYIDMIIIKGNKKTKDKVIRREILLKEGDLFDSSKLQLSREKVYNLGFFKQVNIDVRPGSRDGYMNLIVDVEEQPTGTISLGGGYGTTSGFSIFADVAENNLLGNGQRVGVRFEYGPERTSITLSFAERWLFNQPIGLNTSVFYNLYNVKSNQTVFPTLDNESEYKREGFGYALGLSYRFLDYFSAGASWSHAFTRVKDPSGNSSEEVYYSKRLGFQEKRSVTVFATFDNKDNYLNPTKGGSVEFATNFTGGSVLGGSDHYIKLSPDAAVYFSPFHLPFLKSHPCVFEFRASGDFIMRPAGVRSVNRRQPRQSPYYYLSDVDLKDPWLEPEDRLNLGGPETLRGWDYYDKKFPESWQDVGLFHRILYGVEFRVPIHPQMLWFAVFFDAGSLWSDTFWEKQMTKDNQKIIYQDLATGKLHRVQDIFTGDVNLLKYFKYSYGFGFRIQIPMMPLRFWFGRKLIYNGRFTNVGGFQFQFGIGDMRF